MASTVGVALIQMLEQYRVEHVFGIPGVHTIELYRGLSGSSIAHHTPRHEQGAGFMADGYARSSGKPGVCFVITGPGLTNISTAMGQALADSIPMLVISAVNSPGSTSHTRGQLHEMPNQSGFAANVARFSETITRADDLPGALARAFSQFACARPGPVHLEIPVPLLSQHCELAPVKNLASEAAVPAAGSLRRAIDTLNQSQTPLILIGGGARHASEPIRRLAEKLDAPVAMTINARGVLGVAHELALPISGSVSALRDLVNRSDTVLAIGTELAPTDYDMYRDCGFDIPGRLIRCDIDNRALYSNFEPHIALCADASTTATLLLDGVDQKQRNAAHDVRQINRRAIDELDLNTQKHLALLNAVRERHPDAVFVGDSTQLVYSGNMAFGTDNGGQWFNSSTGFGTLGYALPAAIGAAIDNPERPIICLIGDGGLQFVLGELGTLADSQLPLAVLVWANQGYREIKSSMRQHGVEPVGVDLSVPDFCQIANAYGLEARRADTVEQLLAAIEQVSTAKAAMLIEMPEQTTMQQLGT